MPLTAESGVFGTGTFDNAKFDNKTFQPPETVHTSSTPSPSVNPGTSTVNATETILTETTPDPAVNGGPVTISSPETILTSSTPTAVTVSEAFLINATETVLSETTPNPAVTPANVTISPPETVLTQTTEDPSLNTIITLAATTSLNVSTPSPAVTPADVTVSSPETVLSETTPNPAVQPGAATVKQTNPDVLTQQDLTASVLPGNVDINADATDLVQTSVTPEGIAIDIIVNHPTRNLILTKDKWLDTMQHTFKVEDRADEFRDQLKDDDGNIDLTGVQDVRLVISDYSTGNKELDQSVTITDASNGKIKYEWSQGDPIDTAGLYQFEVVIENSDGDVTVPNDGYGVIEIEEDKD